ncbi:MAG TPA: hypothetical protein VFM46_18930, partial [Pseudomonadales bacterium]|nr:hypothetical protein [Pseudomonadales bacterium]
MVKKFTYLFLLISTIFTLNCSAKPACTKGSEFEPPLCVSPYTQVDTVTIKINGDSKTKDAETAVQCKSFLLDADKLKLYFSKARLTNENDAHHTLDWSPCFASGEIAFSNGQVATREINQFRV